MATTDMLLTRAHPTATTARTGLWAASLLAQALGTAATGAVDGDGDQVGVAAGAGADVTTAPAGVTAVDGATVAVGAEAGAITTAGLADIAAAGTAEVSVAESRVQADSAVARHSTEAVVVADSMAAVAVDSTEAAVDAANPA